MCSTIHPTFGISFWLKSGFAYGSIITAIMLNGLCLIFSYLGFIHAISCLNNSLRMKYSRKYLDKFSNAVILIRDLIDNLTVY
jgi:hypothetical protein